MFKIMFFDVPGHFHVFLALSLKHFRLVQMQPQKRPVTALNCCSTHSYIEFGRNAKSRKSHYFMFRIMFSDVPGHFHVLLALSLKRFRLVQRCSRKRPVTALSCCSTHSCIEFGRNAKSRKSHYFMFRIMFSDVPGLFTCF